MLMRIHLFSQNITSMFVDPDASKTIIIPFKYYRLTFFFIMVPILFITVIWSCFSFRLIVNGKEESVAVLSFLFAGLFSFWSQPDSHGKAKICQFIEQTVENSKNGRFLYFLRPAGPGSPPLPIQLLYPVSRFCRVPSLQHMCRFLVLRWVRRDHIDHLPLPQKVKAYLLEKQYYVESLEED